MYCRRCYAKLFQNATVCWKCGRKFDPSAPDTYLSRPFPGEWRILKHIVYTTAIGLAVAFIVSMHQLAAASGH
jgi:predicted amidophosphoribosyltransferase